MRNVLKVGKTEGNTGRKKGVKEVRKWELLTTNLRNLEGETSEETRRKYILNLLTLKRAVTLFLGLPFGGRVLVPSGCV